MERIRKKILSLIVIAINFSIISSASSELSNSHKPDLQRKIYRLRSYFCGDDSNDHAILTDGNPIYLHLSEKTPSFTIQAGNPMKRGLAQKWGSNDPKELVLVDQYWDPTSKNLDETPEPSTYFWEPINCLWSYRAELDQTNHQLTLFTNEYPITTPPRCRGAASPYIFRAIRPPHSLQNAGALKYDYSVEGDRLEIRIQNDPSFCNHPKQKFGYYLKGSSSRLVFEVEHDIKPTVEKK